jgi:IS30 family transposase
MSKHFKQLLGSERVRIYRFLSLGMSQSEIAERLKRNKSTIGREIKRNCHEKLDEYLPDTADKKAVKRRLGGRKRSYIAKNHELKDYIITGLEDGWSPEEISGRMRDQKMPFYTNHESIYQYIYGPDGRRQNLKCYLRRAHRIRRKKHGRKTIKAKIPNRIDIALRPKIVEKKKQFGHWEGDTMMFLGHKQNLATHTERKTRFIAAIRPKSLKAVHRSRAAQKVFNNYYPEAKRTMTLDNGSENTEHEAITEKTGLKIFFARPYASWQRGANENSNGLIRWYLPRHTDLNSLTERNINDIIDLINNRPRKCLNYKTPKEMFELEMNKIIRKNNFKNIIQLHL